MPDPRIAAEDRSVGVDDDMIFQCRVTFGSTHQVASGFVTGKAEGAERDALINFDVVADFGRLADDDACAVINKESPADRFAGWISIPVFNRAYSVIIRGIIGTPRACSS